MLQTLELTVTKKTMVQPHIVLLEAQPTAEFIAGQYAIFMVPQSGSDKPMRRLYSYANAPSQNKTEFLIEYIQGGIGSEFIRSLQLGDNFTIQSPAGIFTIKDTSTNICFLATGTGIAPMRSMLFDLIGNNFSKNITLYWGVKRVEHLYFQNDFLKLVAKNQNVHLNFCLSQETNLESVPSELRPFIKLGRIQPNLTPLPNTDFYICGIKETVQSLREFLEANRIDKTHIHFERFN